jgi:hypothetical protein
MYQLTPTQQQALETYKTTGELGILSNLLIEHCLEELEKNSINFEKLDPLNSVVNSNQRNYSFKEFWQSGATSMIDEYGDQVSDTSECYTNFNDLISKDKICVIQALLSHTPDGQEVMPFLDVEVAHLVSNTKEGGKEWKQFNLDHILYRNFTESLRIGKTLEEGLLEITKDYINHFYL